MLRHFDIDESLWLLYPRTFSGGEKLRLNIAAAMIKQPRFAAARRANCLVGCGVEGEGA